MSVACFSDLREELDTMAALAKLREEYNIQYGAIDNLRTCLNEARATKNALTTTLATARNAAANAVANAAAPHGGHLRIPGP